MTVQPGYHIDRDDEGLTARERQVLAGLMAGKSQYRIAQDLGLSKERIRALAASLREKGAL